MIYPRLRLHHINGYRVLGFYHYDANVRMLLLRYKEGCDRYLGRIFLAHDRKVMNLIFRDWVIICAPSRRESQITRTFHHLELMLEGVCLPICDVLVNTAQYDQSQVGDRRDIRRHITLKDTHLIEDKKVLVFDDIMTSGETMGQCLDLVSQYAQRAIGIVVAYTKE